MKQVPAKKSAVEFLPSGSSSATNRHTRGQVRADEVRTYTALRSAVRGAVARGRERAFRAVERETVLTAWEVGRLIRGHLLLNQDRAEYGAKVMDRLARDTGISRTELNRMVEFAEAYPIRAPARELPWSHYRDLLAVNDNAKRKVLIAAAAEEGWSRVRLRSEIRRVKGRPQRVPELEAVVPGRPGVYRVIEAEAGPHAGRAVVDLGFSAHYRPRSFRLKAGAMVEVRAGRLGKIPAETQLLYTYRAAVEEVIDGDTLWVVVDLAFGLTMKQKLRLRGVNAPELRSKAGVEARRYVMRRLGRVKEILIRTTKSDKYDRYLADVFISDSWLNGDLVRNGFAAFVS